MRAGMGRREHESVEVWSQRVAAWRSSGLSGGKFAKRHGLKESSLYRWGKRLGDGEQPPARRKQFAEVVVKPAVSETTAIEVVLCNGRVVRVRGPVDAAQLRVVVAALESC